jgi:hypothetical protein
MSGFKTHTHTRIQYMNIISIRHMATYVYYEMGACMHKQINDKYMQHKHHTTHRLNFSHAPHHQPNARSPVSTLMLAPSQQGGCPYVSRSSPVERSFHLCSNFPYTNRADDAHKVIDMTIISHHTYEMRCLAHTHLSWAIDHVVDGMALTAQHGTVPYDEPPLTRVHSCQSPHPYYRCCCSLHAISIHNHSIGFE